MVPNIHSQPTPSIPVPGTGVDAYPDALHSCSPASAEVLEREPPWQKGTVTSSKKQKAIPIAICFVWGQAFNQ